MFRESIPVWDLAVIVTGYAKEDWLFHPVEKGRLYEFGIPRADKYIFWLPTFRSTDEKLKQLNEYSIESEVGLPIIDTMDRLRELNELLWEMGMVLVVKLHSFQKAEMVQCKGFSNICLIDNMNLVDADIQVNQLLGYADALISDYSSAAVDYLVLDRPIAFTLDDVEEYNSSRGFVFDCDRADKNWINKSVVLQAHGIPRLPMTKMMTGTMSLTGLKLRG